MKSSLNIQSMQQVWSKLLHHGEGNSPEPQIEFEETISAVFSLGPCYHYLLDFYDMSINNISSSFKEIHGIDSEEIHHINQIIGLVHPEDIPFVISAENLAIEMICNELGADKLMKYKLCYNFRIKTAGDKYELLNHQSLLLSQNEDGKLGKAINIHTIISHLTQKNNFNLSLIGIGEPSYLNIEVRNHRPELFQNQIFTRREMEVLKLITEGLTSEGIADRLFISHETVKTHRKNILEKSACTNTAELIKRSINEGWV